LVRGRAAITGALCSALFERSDLLRQYSGARPAAEVRLSCVTAVVYVHLHVKYNLTDSQKQLGRRIVQAINEGWLSESFFVLWNWSRGPGPIVMRRDGAWRIFDIDRGAVEALAAEAMIRLVEDKNWPAWPKGIGSMLPTLTSMRCDVVQKLFAAVEKNFAEEPQVNEVAPIRNEGQGKTAETPDIFISHSSRDEAVASALINVFEIALPPVRIRCSSVAGYRFTVGGDYREQMRAEVDQSKVFVALLTPKSLRSPEVSSKLVRGGRRKTSSCRSLQPAQNQSY